jgi:hypothetical protein
MFSGQSHRRRGFEYIASVKNRYARCLGTALPSLIERHSEPIGLFVPIATKDQRTRREVIDRLGRLVDDLVCHSGIDEDELIREISSSPSQS